MPCFVVTLSSRYIYSHDLIVIRALYYIRLSVRIPNYVHLRSPPEWRKNGCERLKIPHARYKCRDPFFVVKGSLSA